MNKIESILTVSICSISPKRYSKKLQREFSWAHKLLSFGLLTVVETETAVSESLKLASLLPEQRCSAMTESPC